MIKYGLRYQSKINNSKWTWISGYFDDCQYAGKSENWNWTYDINMAFRALERATRKHGNYNWEIKAIIT